MGLVKEKLDKNKLRGGYYTPKPISDFLCKWSLNANTKKILEPSCGDGNFIHSAIERLRELGLNNAEIGERIQGVELIKEEAQKAQGRVEELGVESSMIRNMDFFHFMENNTEEYDVILGNPPFIRYQSFPEEHRKLAIEMMKREGFNPNKMTNIWVPFLVLSASQLTGRGKLAMVIPAELFQVKYAAESRVFLSNFFQRITIVTFKKLVFKGILQEVVLLLCEKSVEENEGIRVLELENLDDLSNINFEDVNSEDVKPIEHTTEKWTKYFLSEEEICLLRELKQDPRIISCKDILEVDVGLVTGRNEFFMLTKKQVEEWKLEEYTIPVASKSNQLKGLSLSKEDFELNSDGQNAVYLFIPPKVPFKDLPKVCQEYVLHGEAQDFHKGYKCRIRKLWYVTPSLWSPDGFALRQVGDYPKLVVNETNASSTDTIHRVRFKENVDGQLAIMSFINSLSFAFSEITGRSYGGGVMTFEPTEIEDIKMPLIQPLNINFKKLDRLIRNREIEKALDLVDKELLIKIHGFSPDQVSKLRNIWKKLANRRLLRSKSSKLF